MTLADSNISRSQMADINTGWIDGISAFKSSGVAEDSYHKLEYEYDFYGNLDKTDTDVNNLYKEAEGIVGGIQVTTNKSYWETFEYDDLLRLIENRHNWNGATQETTYTYDDAGNITKKSDYAHSYTYYGNSNKLATVASIDRGMLTYAYDNNGNMTKVSSSGTTLETVKYNEFNKPISMNRVDAQNEPQNHLIAFNYGADLMRFRQYQQTNNVEVLYVDKMFESRREPGAIKRRYFLDGIAIVNEQDATESVEKKQTIRFQHTDRLGSVVALFDQDGKMWESHSFDPFGKPRKNPDVDVLSSTIGSDYNTRGFTGHEHIDKAQIIHMNGRGYDYNLGRFLSVDPFIVDPGNSQAINPYSYILNNPLSGTDPTGYVACTGSRIDNKDDCNDIPGLKVVGWYNNSELPEKPQTNGNQSGAPSAPEESKNEKGTTLNKRDNIPNPILPSLPDEVSGNQDVDIDIPLPDLGNYGNRQAPLTNDGVMEEIVVRVQASKKRKPVTNQGGFITQLRQMQRSWNQRYQNSMHLASMRRIDENNQVLAEMRAVAQMQSARNFQNVAGLGSIAIPACAVNFALCTKALGWYGNAKMLEGGWELYNDPTAVGGFKSAYDVSRWALEHGAEKALSRPQLAPLIWFNAGMGEVLDVVPNE